MRKKYRVKSEKEFQKVFKQGNSTANRQFVIYTLPKENQDHFRVGISVGKKLGNAVVRNQVKRRIRRALLELDQEGKIIHKVDFLVIARKPVVYMSVQECKKSLTHVLNLAKILN